MFCLKSVGFRVIYERIYTNLSTAFVENYLMKKLYKRPLKRVDSYPDNIDNTQP